MVNCQTITMLIFLGLVVGSLILLFIIRFIKLGALSCAFGFHDFEEKLYYLNEAPCIICRKCGTADYSMGVGL